VPVTSPVIARLAWPKAAETTLSGTPADKITEAAGCRRYESRPRKAAWDACPLAICGHSVNPLVSQLRDFKDRLIVIPEAEMHELAIAESIVQAVQSRIGDRPVRSVHLQVGQLSGVLTDALTFSFELAASGTPLEGADLLIDEPRGRLHCRTCGHDVGRNDLLLLCECGSANVEVTAGRELALVSVEVT
jgi:hydrogenase nickel incorporation protein HypA/HybF